jgi:hypothetical protein
MEPAKLLYTPSHDFILQPIISRFITLNIMATKGAWDTRFFEIRNSSEKDQSRSDLGSYLLQCTKVLSTVHTNQCIISGSAMKDFLN